MQMTFSRSALLSALSLTVLLRTGPLAQRPDTDLSTRLDATLSDTFKADAPGAAVIVVHDGKPVFRKGYGLANLETKTPMRPDMVFQIGSVTKQFTSTAVLILAERGKLSFEDDISLYFPNYPNKGAKITIEHLLTHTSGIKSYTEDPKWPALWREDLTPAQIIDLTKDLPLEFAPGTKFNYNNTAYTMLGVIIEKASGLPYADFLRRNLFEPMGMSHTLYGSLTQIIPNRAAGYTRGADGWENAPYLSLTQPVLSRRSDVECGRSCVVGRRGRVAKADITGVLGTRLCRVQAGEWRTHSLWVWLGTRRVSGTQSHPSRRWYSGLCI